jgi:hypothetical protein
MTNEKLRLVIAWLGQLVITWLGEVTRDDTKRFRLAVALLVLAALVAVSALLNNQPGIAWATFGSVVIGQLVSPTILQASNAICQFTENFLNAAAEWCIGGTIVAACVVLVIGGFFAPRSNYLDTAGRVFTVGMMVATFIGAVATIFEDPPTFPQRVPQELPTAEAAQAEADELLLVEWKKRGQKQGAASR